MADMPASRPAVDPITLEVVKNALASTADEMALVIMRSAYSSVVRETMDYSTALCDRKGRVVAQGLTLAVQLGTFPTVMRYVLEEFGRTAKPGDVYIANDPYGCGGQHLPDIYVIKPIFVAGQLEGYAATMAHHSDVGGIAPGSIAVHATEIYQEGLRIPLCRLYDGGVENTILLRLIEANTRQPIHVMGDLRAQLAACRVGERGLIALLERYGFDAHVYMEELQRVAERMMRAELALLPDGVHTFTDYIDSVGENPVPIPISVQVEIAGDEVRIDFEGTSPQVEASVNCPVGMVYAACYGAIRGIVGGLGYVREYRVLAQRATLTIRSDRRDHPPYGLEGGEPGAPSSNVVVSGDEECELPTMPMEAYTLEQGDRFTHVSAGGGGFGPPFERDVAAVLADVLDGKVSVAAARERYGVVISDGGIDTESTAALRAAR